MPDHQTAILRTARPASFPVCIIEWTRPRAVKSKASSAFFNVPTTVPTTFSFLRTITIGGAPVMTVDHSVYQRIPLFLLDEVLAGWLYSPL
jgi:hypothetical protein